jgi:hypothetical protein
MSAREIHVGVIQEITAEKPAGNKAVNYAYNDSV